MPHSNVHRLTAPRRISKLQPKPRAENTHWMAATPGTLCGQKGEALPLAVWRSLLLCRPKGSDLLYTYIFRSQRGAIARAAALHPMPPERTPTLRGLEVKLRRVSALLCYCSDCQATAHQSRYTATLKNLDGVVVSMMVENGQASPS